MRIHEMKNERTTWKLLLKVLQKHYVYCKISPIFRIAKNDSAMLVLLFLTSSTWQRDLLNFWAQKNTKKKMKQPTSEWRCLAGKISAHIKRSILINQHFVSYAYIKSLSNGYFMFHQNDYDSFATTKFYGPICVCDRPTLKWILCVRYSRKNPIHRICVGMCVCVWVSVTNNALNFNGHTLHLMTRWFNPIHLRRMRNNVKPKTISKYYGKSINYYQTKIALWPRISKWATRLVRSYTSCVWLSDYY